MLPVKLKAKIWLTHNGEMVFGRGRARLLEAVEREGSIAAASKALGLSYRHAWTMLKTSEKRLGYPLLERVKGGSGGGGSRLTEKARKLLSKYSEIEGCFEKFCRGQDDVF